MSQKKRPLTAGVFFRTLWRIHPAHSTILVGFGLIQEVSPSPFGHA
mgnify:CR=1 FL=1